MNNTKDKFKDGVDSFVKFGKDQLDDAYAKVNLIERISKVQDEMSKNSKKSSMDEYECIYIKDEVYSNASKELEKCTNTRSDLFSQISANNMTQEEINIKLDYIKNELSPLIKELEDKLDIRRQQINLDREKYEIQSDKKKSTAKKAMLAAVVAGSGVALMANPNSRKFIIKNGKSLAANAIKSKIKIL